MKITLYSAIGSSGAARIDWGAKGAARVAQNIQNLINLTRYEVAYNRTLGMDPALVDLPAAELQARFAAELMRLIGDNEPRAKVDEVILATVGADGKYDYEVVIDIAG